MSSNSNRNSPSDQPVTTEIVMQQIGANKECGRIRAEFIKWIKSLPNPATINRDYFLDQLDRICPKEPTCQSYEGCRGEGVLDDLSDSGSGRTVYCDCEAGETLRRIETATDEFPMITDERNSEE